MDLVEIFASKYSINDKAVLDTLSKWDVGDMSPETEQLIAEVLMEKALGGSQCSRAYAKDVLGKMKKGRPIDELKIIETIEKTNNEKAFRGVSALKRNSKKNMFWGKMKSLFSVLFGKVTVKGVD